MAQQQVKYTRLNVAEQILRTGLCSLSLQLVELLSDALYYLEFFKWRNSLVMLPPMPHHNRFMDRMKRDYDNICKASMRFSGCSKHLSVKQLSLENQLLRPLAKDIFLPPDMKPITDCEVSMAYLKYWELQRKNVLPQLIPASASSAIYHTNLQTPI